MNTHSKIKANAKLSDYIKIARLDHVTKHIFIIPGIVAAWLLVGIHLSETRLIINVCLGLLALIAVASANYVINEFLDREFDRHHPEKCARASVQCDMSPQIIFLEWLGLITFGCLNAWFVGGILFYAVILLGLQGIIYNVLPFRSKDRAYFDVISESINNPLRLLIGWGMISSFTCPSFILIMAYWSGGAFLMATKRLSEYLQITRTHGREQLTKYRASFLRYNELTLSFSCLTYALLSVSLITIFFLQWRIEYILTLPFLIFLFMYYYHLAETPNSLVQKPELIFKDKKLTFICLLFATVFIVTSFFNMPFLKTFIFKLFFEI